MIPSEAQILIVGGGIMGLSVAYQLARLGQKGILLVDRQGLCMGASGRNGGGVRMQWSREDDVALMQASIRQCRRFAHEMGTDVWFRQGGYLFLAKSADDMGRLEHVVTLQRRAGAPTRLLSASEAQDIVPELNRRGVYGASFNPEDGVLFPWPFIWGYRDQARALGVEILPWVEVVGFERSSGRITHAHLLDRHPHRRGSETSPPSVVKVAHVVNASGADSPGIAALAGVKLSNRPFRHEILTTEPLKPFLGPMVTVIREGLYFSQAMRGELVGGIGDPYESSSYDQSSSLAFLRRFATAAIDVLPLLAHVQVVRQWSGLYDIAPDDRPLLGESAAAPNLTHLVGFGGHGFMMAPEIGRRCARRLHLGEPCPYFDNHPVDRAFDTKEDQMDPMRLG
jgi:sarcosine oxidase, subunit beta